jgi:hypothetical protein
MFMAVDAHTQEPRSVLTLLRYDLLDRLEAGDTAGALTAWRAAYHTGRAIGDEPLSVSQVVRASCRAGAVELLERLLAHTEPGEADLARVQQLLEDDEPAPLFLIAARGERAAGFGTVEEIKAHQANVSAWTAWWKAARSVWNRQLTVAEATAVLPGSLPGQQAALLRHMNRLVEAAKRPVEEWGPRLDAWLAEESHLPALAQMLALAAGKVGEVFRRSHATLRCAAVAVAAERYRRRAGSWPAALGELVQAKLLGVVPIDPYDGRSLKFARSADGLIVYSVGPDQADNGGAIDRQNPTKAGTDLGFRLWDPPARRRPALPKP